MGLSSPYHLLIILLVVLLLFGGKKIPELMRGLGRGMKEFGDAKNKSYEEKDQDMMKPNSSSTTTSTR